MLVTVTLVGIVCMVVVIATMDSKALLVNDLQKTDLVLTSALGMGSVCMADASVLKGMVAKTVVNPLDSVPTPTALTTVSVSLANVSVSLDQVVFTVNKVVVTPSVKLVKVFVS